MKTRLLSRWFDELIFRDAYRINVVCCLERVLPRTITITMPFSVRSAACFEGFTAGGHRWPVVRRLERRRKRLALHFAAAAADGPAAALPTLDDEPCLPRRLDMNMNANEAEARDTETDTEPWSPTMTPPGSVEPIAQPESEELSAEESAAKARIMARYPDTWDDSIPLTAPWATFYREREQELKQEEDGSDDFPFVVDETQAPAPEPEPDGSQEHPFVCC
jgi:hypothetical protein